MNTTNPSRKSARFTRTLTIAILLAALSAAAAMGAPSVSDVTASASSVGLYDPFELRFSVGTVASNLYWPYDARPAANSAEHPNAVPAGVGVSVDGLFLPPGQSDWQAAVVQAGFYFQDYERSNRFWDSSKRDWLYPRGDPCWCVRFAPTQVGQWRYRIRVTDAGGTVLSPERVFTCVDSENHGFVRVSANDCRYFETSDGHYLNFLGLQDYTTETYAMDELYPKLAANGINLLRPWWQGSQGPVLFGLSGEGGIPRWVGVNLTTEAARPGQLFSGKITTNRSVSIAVDVLPNTSYKFSAWVKTLGVTGADDCGAFLQASDCTQADEPLTAKLRGDTDWTLLSATVTTKPEQYSIGWLKITVSGITSGAVYWTDMSLRQDLGSGQLGPELVPMRNLNKHLYVSQQEAWRADYQVECARRNGIYLKVCLQEKKDNAFGRIQADGSAGDRSDDNVYAATTHASRTYQKYFWRYIIARYGWASSIHSFEFCNEGDPFNGNHANALAAFSSFWAQNDPNKHLCTTSNWHSYPTAEMWSKAPDLGYTDWHQYIGKQTGSHLQYIYGWKIDESYFDPSVYRSAPYSLHASGDGGSDYRLPSYPIPVAPGHKYTVGWYMKGSSVAKGALHPEWSYPTLGIAFASGWWGYIVGSYILPREPAELLGDFGWTSRQATFTVPDDAHYITLTPQIHWCTGDVWFDDITIHDDTAGEYVECPNGDFDSARLDYDTALMTYSLGTQVGLGDSRQIRKPIIRGESGISGDNIYGSPYKGFTYTGENQQLVDDAEGVWYRKFVWAHINPYGVVDLYWWQDNMKANGLWKYSRAYQEFMRDIKLSSGHYRDAKAAVSTRLLRAWGQKDLVNNCAHLWIDSVRRTWKNTVDGVDIPPVSGTVTVSGLQDGQYTVEWWNTTTGLRTRTEDVDCKGGNLELSVQNLRSDVACKIYRPRPVLDLRMSVPSEDVAPGDVVTVSVEFANTGKSDAGNAEVSVRVPAELEYVAGSAEASSGRWDPISSTVTWIVDSVPVGQSGSRTFRARVR